MPGASLLVQKSERPVCGFEGRLDAAASLIRGLPREGKRCRTDVVRSVLTTKFLTTQDDADIKP